MDFKKVLMDLQCEMVFERNLVNPKEISWLQYDILCQLEREKRILPSRLSLILGVSRTKLSKALKELKTMGYIDQVPNKLDGRELFTSISQDGKEILKNISLRHDKLFNLGEEIFSEEEQEIFAKLSVRLSKELRKARLDDGQ